MSCSTITDRHKEILDLINDGFCLPREIAFELKANKSNISTALKHLLDQGMVVREKFYSTYIYALSKEELRKVVSDKSKTYSKQMKQERTIFCRRRNSFSY
ncbi:MAG: helix-turn-helix domain-containing protein [Cyanobacteriota bacterium]